MGGAVRDGDISKINIIFGWCWLFLGILGAMWMGSHAFAPDWLGGYISISRRLLRLAHIAFMALSLTNVLYGLCMDSVSLPIQLKKVGSFSMIIAAVSMPLVCLASIASNSFQIFFCIPVLSFCLAVFIMIVGQIKYIKYERRNRR